jgi:hypothetical protein
MKYTVDISKISVNEYKEILRNTELLPSRKILHQDLDACFNAILNRKINNLGELKKAMSSKEKIASLSTKLALSEEYLIILRREIGSMETKIVLLKEFPEIESKALDFLHKYNIKSSKDYFEFYLSFYDKNIMEEKYLLSEIKAHEIFCLCDLVRINGVGALAAKSFFEAGFQSVDDVSRANATEMLSKVSFVNNDKQYYKAKLGVKDMQFCIDCAKLILNIERSAN